MPDDKLLWETKFKYDDYNFWKNDITLFIEEKKEVTNDAVKLINLYIKEALIPTGNDGDEDFYFVLYKEFQRQLNNKEI